MKVLTNIKKFLDDHPIITLGSFVITSFTIAYSVSYTLLENKYESKIQEYQVTLSSITRRLGGNSAIDVSKIKIHKDSANLINEKSIYFSDDNFFSTTDNYWKYKYTNTIELSYIKNGKPVPDHIKNNPIDMPIHIWSGGNEYRITQPDWQDAVEPYSLYEKDSLNVLIYHTDPIVFKPTITLQRRDRSGNSFRMRSKYQMDSILYSVDFDEVVQNELMGKFLSDEMQEYFQDIPIREKQREVLSVEKSNDMLYSSFLTTYKNIEVNNKKQKSFFVWREVIMLCTDKDLYIIDIETPSLEPRKIGNSFEKISDWYDKFGIVVN